MSKLFKALRSFFLAFTQSPPPTINKVPNRPSVPTKPTPTPAAPVVNPAPPTTEPPVVAPPATTPPAPPVVSSPVTIPDSHAVPGISAPQWLGAWSGDVRQSVAAICSGAVSGVIKLLIAYDIPGRDNGNYSSGGLKSPEEYAAWIADIAAGIGTASVWFILEPDALGLSLSLSAELQQERYEMLAAAVRTLKQQPNVAVFVDASTWVNHDDMVRLLQQVPGVDGFSCNVSGYNDTASVVAWADPIAEATNLRYIIDTSRNGFGNPHPGMWCNVTDTKVGNLPTSYQSGWHMADVWAKVPGESDGPGINDDGSHPRSDIPAAGDPFPDYKTAIYSGDWTEFKAKYGG